MSRKINGGWAWGAIRYTVEAEPVFITTCHCNGCKQASGSEMAVVVGVPSENFELLKGKPSAWSCEGGSGKDLTRCFCPTCGSRLYTKADILPDLVLLQAGNIDDKSWITPSMAIFTKDKSHWMQLTDDVTTFTEAPDR
jgi:hypothetical protein